MQTIVLGTPSAEQSLSSLLRATGRDEIAIVDEQGAVVAHLTPADPIDDEVYARVADAFRKDAAELERRFANRGPCRTTAEVMERLQKLDGVSCDIP